MCALCIRQWRGIGGRNKRKNKPRILRNTEDTNKNYNKIKLKFCLEIICKANKKNMIQYCEASRKETKKATTTNDWHTGKNEDNTKIPVGILFC